MKWKKSISFKFNTPSRITSATAKTIASSASTASSRLSAWLSLASAARASSRRTCPRRAARNSHNISSMSLRYVACNKLERALKSRSRSSSSAIYRAKTYSAADSTWSSLMSACTKTTSSQTCPERWRSSASNSRSERTPSPSRSRLKNLRLAMPPTPVCDTHARRAPASGASPRGPPRLRCLLPTTALSVTSRAPQRRVARSPSPSAAATAACSRAARRLTLSAPRLRPARATRG
mmetsp:Transcript_54619/g.158077  ORF Transcript_54619/g.158077 Transcript_54619/m.158077 type:complete len:236 (-) Transcript_54619:100-807(-)